MKLIIDIGNTAVKIALFKDKDMVRSAKISHCSLNDIANFIQQEKVSRTILSTVKSIDTSAQQVIKYYNSLVLGYNTPIPITVKYKSPETLGNDRLAAVVGGAYLYPGKNILVFDAGTCLTMDVINDRKEYIGGRISPGLLMRYNALSEFTDNLPNGNIVNNHLFLGNNTISSINSGVQQGIISEVTDFITTFEKENKDTIVIFTGGDCFFFENVLKSTIFAHPFLVQTGLNEILDYNE